jgi:hypothetical protein
MTGMYRLTDIDRMIGRYELKEKDRVTDRYELRVEPDRLTGNRARMAKIANLLVETRARLTGLYGLADTHHPTGRHVPSNRMTDKYRLTSKDREPGRYALGDRDGMTGRFSLSVRDKMTVNRVYVRQTGWRV